MSHIPELNKSYAEEIGRLQKLNSELLEAIKKLQLDIINYGHKSMRTGDAWEYAQATITKCLLQARKHKTFTEKVNP